MGGWATLARFLVSRTVTSMSNDPLRVIFPSLGSSEVSVISCCCKTPASASCERFLLFMLGIWVPQVMRWSPLLPAAPVLVLNLASPPALRASITPPPLRLHSASGPSVPAVRSIPVRSRAVNASAISLGILATTLTRATFPFQGASGVSFTALRLASLRGGATNAVPRDAAETVLVVRQRGQLHVGAGFEGNPWMSEKAV